MNMSKKYIAICLLNVMLIAGCSYPSTPVKGETWIYQYGDDNPFKETTSHEYLILDVQNGYVKYQDVRTGEINSQGISYFKVGSHLKAE